MCSFHFDSIPTGWDRCSILGLQEIFFGQAATRVYCEFEGSLAELIVFGIHLRVFEDRLVFPEVEGGLELAGSFGILSFVAGFFDPAFEDFAVAFEFGLVGGIRREIFDLVGVGGEVVEFFGGALSEPVGFLIRSEFSFFAKFFELEDGRALVAVLGLEHGAVGEVVPDVAELLGAHGADAVDGVVAAVAGGDDVGAGFVIGGEKVATVEVVGHLGSAEGEGSGGEVEAGDHVVSDGSGFERRVVAFDHAGDVDAAFVAAFKLPDDLQHDLATHRSFPR